MNFEPIKEMRNYKKYKNLGISGRCQGFFVKPVKSKIDTEYDCLIFVLWHFVNDKLKIIGYLERGSDTITFEGEGWHCDFDNGVPNYWNTFNKEIRYFTLTAYTTATAGDF